MRLYAMLFAALLLSYACTQAPDGGESTTAKAEEGLKLDYQKYTLDNGLEVILHKDTSDPIVSVAVLYHVGSNREEKGRTGFAHLFEHMLFQESQHVPQDTFFKNIQGAGGTLNGGTWKDGTIYFEIVPKNALEMVLWMESDRMGWLLSTVNQESFENQQDVVQNEKRQRVDNRPYGHTGYVIDKNLYPEDHPYNWQVIGSFEDLQNATLQDIRDFYNKWYGPNNATLSIAGDFDEAEVKALVEKYFGEIKSSAPVPDPVPTPVTLDTTKRVYHEDNFARSPELNMVFPTIQQYEADAYALSMLGTLMSDGKKAPLYKVIVEEKALAPDVSAFQNSGEMAGSFRIRVRAFPDTELTKVEAAIKEAFARFETEGITDQDLDRLKAQAETSFYNGLTSVFNKSFQLASYNEYAGDPGFLNKDLQGTLAVTTDDVKRVFNTYIKDKNYVLTSFVPKGKLELVAENSDMYPVVEEDLSNAGSGERTVVALEVEQIPSSFDRSVKPEPGPAPATTVPTVWSADLDNGAAIFGIEQNELPLISMTITLEGGMLLDPTDKVGVANLITDVMMEGTADKTPVELEEAIDQLGANINMFTRAETITLSINTLAAKFPQVMELVEEIMLKPRWDEAEFERIKKETVETITQRETQPTVIANRVFNKLVYGQDHPMAQSTLGTIDVVETLTIDDLKAYYAANFSPKAAHIAIAGDIDQAGAVKALSSLTANWSGDDVIMPQLPTPPNLDATKLYFVDKPGAKQSVINVGHLALPYTHPDYYAATVMNYQLGGSFNSNLNMILREEKGYTYGARSGFRGSRNAGPFVASSQVRTNVTKESVEIFRDELTGFRDGITEEDMTFTQNALIQSNTRAFETLGALLGMINNIARYDMPKDYIKQREDVVRNMTVDSHRELAQKYLAENKVYLVVGDAATQLEPLKELGLGDPILVDTNAKPVTGGPGQ